MARPGQVTRARFAKIPEAALRGRPARRTVIVLVRRSRLARALPNPGDLDERRDTASAMGRLRFLQGRHAKE
jgi:hypothetical protein